MKKLIIVLLVIFLSFPAYAATDSVSGNAEHNQPFSSFGSGYEADVSPEPLTWETAEEGTIGQSITTGGYWSKRIPAKIDFNGDTLRNNKTTKNIKCSYDTVQGYDGWFYRSNIGFGTKAYGNFWVYCDFTAGEGVPGPEWMLKLWRANSDGDVHGSEPNVNHTMLPVGDNSVRVSEMLYGARNSDGTSSQSISLTESSNQTPLNKIWINIAFAWKASSAVDIADGEVTFWTSDTPSGTMWSGSITGLLTRTTASPLNIDALALGYLLENGGEEAYSYFDNIYTSGSWKRVEVGDNIDYDQCAIREIQYINQRTDGQIDVLFNQGSLLDGAAYWHVTLEDGSHQPGFLINIGTAPPATYTAQAKNCTLKKATLK